MVRERVGDWRLAWRFALAGLIAGMLVTAFGYLGVIGRSFDAALASAIASARNVVLVCTADDAPRPEFSTVAAAVGERGFATPDAADSVRGVELRPNNACPENEAREPAFLQAFRIFKLGAIRENTQSPWVKFPTDAALAAYAAQKRLYAWQSVFAAAGAPEP